MIERDAAPEDVYEVLTRADDVIVVTLFRGDE